MFSSSFWCFVENDNFDQQTKLQKFVTNVMNDSKRFDRKHSFFRQKHSLSIFGKNIKHFSYSRRTMNTKSIAIILLFVPIVCFANNCETFKGYFESLTFPDKVPLKEFDNQFEICDEYHILRSHHCKELQTLLDCANLARVNQDRTLLKTSATCKIYFGEFLFEQGVGVNAGKLFYNTAYHIEELFDDVLPIENRLILQQKIIRYLISTYSNQDEQPKSDL